MAVDEDDDGIWDYEDDCVSSGADNLDEDGLDCFNTCNGWGEIIICCGEEHCVGNGTCSSLNLVEDECGNCQGPCGTVGYDGADCRCCDSTDCPANHNCYDDGLISSYCYCNIDPDCAGVCGGDAALDDCGVCNGDNSPDCCGVNCGDGSSCNGVCGTCNDDTSCLDDCGVPNGDNSPDCCGVNCGDGDTCDDCCGVACGDGDTCDDCCGVACGDGDTCDDCCGVACGDGSGCDDCCGVACGDGSSCDGVCGACNDDTSCLDDCGVPNGDNSPDCCGVNCGDGSTCDGVCGACNDDDSCLDECGTPNGDNSPDCCGVNCGDGTSCDGTCGACNAEIPAGACDCDGNVDNEYFATGTYSDPGDTPVCGPAACDPDWFWSGDPYTISGDCIILECVIGENANPYYNGGPCCPNGTGAPLMWEVACNNSVCEIVESICEFGCYGGPGGNPMECGDSGGTCECIIGEDDGCPDDMYCCDGNSDMGCVCGIDFFGCGECNGVCKVDSGLMVGGKFEKGGNTQAIKIGDVVRDTNST
jgi:hypothetical protein